MKVKAIELEKKRRLILSSRPEVEADPSLEEALAPTVEGTIFLKKMLEETKTRVEPKAQMRPKTLEAETSKEQANMTPRVRGMRAT